MNKQRLGRGNSSSRGNTCGRGQKGQKSRSGYSSKLFFEGGQTPINIRIPKFGFRKKKTIYGFNSNLFIKNLNISVSNIKLLFNDKLYFNLNKNIYLYRFFTNIIYSKLIIIGSYVYE